MNRYYDVFLSHSSKDKPYVDVLQERLKGRKYKVWYDKTNISLGYNLEETIEKGLRDSYYGIVILSRHYLAESRWTKFEFDRILSSGKIFLITHQITLDELKMEYPLIHDVIKERLVISSEPGLDYVLDQVNKKIRDSIINQKPELTQLRDHLAAGEWKAADITTFNLINPVPKNGLFSFPQEDLTMINRLWLTYSDERYGFSIQKEIYLQVSHQSGEDYLDAYNKFCASVGWFHTLKNIRVSDILRLNPNAGTPRGYFPVLVYLRDQFPLNSPLTPALHQFKLTNGYNHRDEALATLLSGLSLLALPLAFLLPIFLLIFLILLIAVFVMLGRIWWRKRQRALLWHKFFSNRDF